MTYDGVELHGMSINSRVMASSRSWWHGRQKLNEFYLAYLNSSQAVITYY